jgi:alkanesulfonate monooxygenase SsuD/methylene tetrahydromethanopterin reductase-like flavin-dependent oxidoreductase (luciferase family)
MLLIWIEEARMAPKIGYLLPTREAIMEGRPAVAPLLTLAEKAEDLGYDSIWVGDSITAKPRHEPITLLAAVAGRTRRVALGTAVLLPALRNPVVLAHQIATLDQASEGRVILGVGIAADIPAIHDEFRAVGAPFEKRVGTMLEGLRLCQALWTGEPVDWDGRWTLKGQSIGPTPHRKGGPPVWGGGSQPASLTRAAKNFDGWFPTGPTDFAKWGTQWRDVQGQVVAAGRDAKTFTGALYLSLAIDDSAEKANATLDKYLEAYYMQPAAKLRRWQACYGGPAEGAAEWLKGYVDQGASHLMLRFAGDHDRHLQDFANIRASLGW